MSKIQDGTRAILDKAVLANEKDEITSILLVYTKNDKTFVTHGGISKDVPIAALLGPIEDAKLSLHGGVSGYVRTEKA